MLTPKERTEIMIWLSACTISSIDENGKPEVLVKIKTVDDFLEKYVQYDECTPCISYRTCSDDNKGARCEYYQCDGE